MREILTNEADWLAKRQTVVTATEAASLLGANPWSSPNKMWKEKTQSTFFGNAYTIIGNWLEPVVVDATNMKLGTQFQLLESTPGEKVFYTHPTVRLGATPDAYDGHMFLECKTTKPANWVRYSGWPPQYYILQLQVQMMCANISEGYLAILSTDLRQDSPRLRLPLSIFHVKACPKIWALLEEETNRFWKSIDEGKQFRVKSDIKKRTQMLLALSWERIYVGD